MIYICGICTKTVSQDNKGRGVQKTFCRFCGLKALAEMDMLSKEEADELNQLLGGSK